MRSVSRTRARVTMSAVAPSGSSQCRHVTAGAWPRGPGWYVRTAILLPARGTPGPGM